MEPHLGVLSLPCPARPHATVAKTFELLQRAPFSPYLASYLELERRRDRLLVLSEHYPHDLGADLGTRSAPPPEGEARRLAAQVLLGLEQLHARGVVHGCLCASGVAVSSSAAAAGLGLSLRLTGYGLRHLSSGGAAVPFPLGHPGYLAPEVVAGAASTFASDVWAFGVLLVRCCQSGAEADDAGTQMARSAAMAAACTEGGSAAWVQERAVGRSELLLEVARLCLSLAATDRPSAADLLAHPWFDHPDVAAARARGDAAEAGSAAVCELAAAYHQWQRLGGDIEQVSLAATRGDAQGALARLPVLQRVADAVGRSVPAARHDERVVCVSLRQLRAEGGSAATPAQQPEREDDDAGGGASAAAGAGEALRVKLFRQLMLHLPSSRQEIVREAADGIPSTLRAEIWAVLLDVNLRDAVARYDAIDTDSVGLADKQIAVDVPRTHQYHVLLASTEGRAKLARVLKAWIANFSELNSYWQGLDSLAAPFVVLNFHSEAMAFGCLASLTERYLNDFFSAGQTDTLQNHLCVLSRLLSHWHPLLSAHLRNHGVEPELYAIPWLLTLFSHMLKMPALYEYWDAIFLFPGDQLLLFIAMASLGELEQELLALDFDELLMTLSSVKLGEGAAKVLETARIKAVLTPASVSTAWPAVPLEAQKSSMLCPFISSSDLNAVRASSSRRLVVIDARPQAAFAAEHLDGAVSRSAADASSVAKVAKEFADVAGGGVLPKDQPLIVVVGASEADGQEFAAGLCGAGVACVVVRREL